jgi:hypothetical protein
MLIIGWVLFPTAARAQLQLGVRLDAVTSMQWSGPTIFLEALNRVALETDVDEIREIWPGPMPGTFAASTNKGLGILLGRKIVVGGYLLSADALLRSSRYDAIWALRTTDTGCEITEVHSNGLTRRVWKSVRNIIDFDVDMNGRIVFITDEYLGLVTDTAKETLVGLPRELTNASRVFVDANTEQVVVYRKGLLGKLDFTSGKWVFQEFVEEADALVRHFRTRKMWIETKFKY